MLPMEFDIHTHSVSSGHYTKDTVTDMVKQAKLLNLKLLGVCEHGPALPGSCKASYFRSLSSGPSVRMGVHLLYGSEVNIMDYNGSLDLGNDILKKLDYCMAGIHSACFVPGSIGQNTSAYIGAMKNPYIKMIAHPDDVKYPVDYKQLIEAALDYHVLLEINNRSLSPFGYRGDTKENDRTILELCRKYHYPVVLSSDSHGHSNIGDFTHALSLVKECGFPSNLILNHSGRKLLAWLDHR